MFVTKKTETYRLICFVETGCVLRGEILKSLLRRVLKTVKSDFEIRRISVSVWLCLSVRREQLGSHCAVYNGNWYSRAFWKSAEKTQISFKSDKNNVWLRTDIFTFMIVDCWILRRVRNVWEKRVQEGKIQSLCSSIFLLKSLRLYDKG